MTRPVLSQAIVVFVFIFHALPLMGARNQQP